MSCKSIKFSELNQQFNDSQIKSTENSPFNSAKSMGSELNVQMKFRDSYIDRLKEIQAEYPENPIIVVENYDFICFGCPADYVSFFNNKILITFNLDMNTNKYVEKKENKNIDDLIFEDGFYYDIIEIYENLNSEKKWNSNPERYGTEDCFDGGHTFYNIYYPDEKIESMYMRCWISKDFRNMNRTD